MAFSDADFIALLGQNEMALDTDDLVHLNLTVAQGIPALAGLDIGHYCRVVDGWTEQFTRWLPDVERQFHRAPSRFKDDIRFFRLGMLAVFMGLELGLDYIEEQKSAKSIRYRNPSDLFLNGLIDTRRGTCASLPTLHVAMSRRLGWPVSLACAAGHIFSRFDDGRTHWNIDPARVEPGMFFEDSDEGFMRRYNLPPKAISCGSDLRSLTGREMLGLFLSLRARYFADNDETESAETSYCLARALFPRHRATYIAARHQTLTRGKWLFETGELGHPHSLYEMLAQTYAPVEMRMVGAANAPQATVPVFQFVSVSQTAHRSRPSSTVAFSEATINGD